jgi:SAM-dependent methyltransferase
MGRSGGGVLGIVDRITRSGMTASDTDLTRWRPPSTQLECRDGIWSPRAVSAVSYPDEGNEVCFQVEDASYWFAHRNECIMEALRQFPASGMIYDIGGGNGFVALGLQNAGVSVALLEPGSGAVNAKKRGLQNIIHGTLEDAGFAHGSLPAAGAFDVVEHIEDDVGFLSRIRELLQPGGRFYCTVPASQALWSDEDIHAGHFRRYSVRTLEDALRRAGLVVEFVTPFFMWLMPLVFLMRSVPFRIRGNRAAERGGTTAVKNDHILPGFMLPMTRRLHAWELSRLRQARAIPSGTSLLAVAHAPPAR